MILIKVPFQSVGSNSVQMLLFYLLAHFKGYVNTKWNLALINVINGTCVYQLFIANMAALKKKKSYHLFEKVTSLEHF